MSIDTFLIKEYRSRTQEIQDLMKEARQLELYSGGAVAALFSWFATLDLSASGQKSPYFQILVIMLSGQ